MVSGLWAVSWRITFGATAENEGLLWALNRAVRAGFVTALVRLCVLTAGLLGRGRLR